MIDTLVGKGNCSDEIPYRISLGLRNDIPVFKLRVGIAPRFRKYYYMECRLIVLWRMYRSFAIIMNHYYSSVSNEQEINRAITNILDRVCSFKKRDKAFWENFPELDNFFATPISSDDKEEIITIYKKYWHAGFRLETSASSKYLSLVA